MHERRHRVGWWVLVLIMTAGLKFQAQQVNPGASALAGTWVGKSVTIFQRAPHLHDTPGAGLAAVLPDSGCRDHGHAGRASATRL